MRFIAAQFKAYFADDLWKRNAEHSNAMARQLYNAIKDEKALDVVYPVQANGVFVRLPREVWTELQKYYFFYDWDEDDNVRSHSWHRWDSGFYWKDRNAAHDPFRGPG